jgi:hypothetical protein
MEGVVPGLEPDSVCSVGRERHIYTEDGGCQGVWSGRTQLMDRVDMESELGRL